MRIPIISRLWEPRTGPKNSFCGSTYSFFFGSTTSGKSGSAIRTAVIFFYVSKEGVSIVENSAKIGLPIPQKLKDILEQLNKEEKNNG